MAQKQSKKVIVLLDAHAIIHRAYHALPDFASSKGEPTGALYGLSLMLLSIIDQFKPYAMYACFDLPKPTYRHNAYEDYKAGRKEADDELVSQIKKARNVFNAFGIESYDAEGFEADDMLGTFVEKLKHKKDIQIVIASGDMDTLQLVRDDDVVVFTLRKGVKDTVLYDEKSVYERFGFGPNLLPDYKGLRGDPSDNIIGVKGIGEKSATELITHFGTIEDIYNVLEKKPDKALQLGIKQRIIDVLLDHREDAEFSKMLATIRRDAPLEFTFPQKEWREMVEPEKILTLFRELEFKSLSQRVVSYFKLDKDNEEQEQHIDPHILSESKIMIWLLNSDMTDPDLSDIYDYTKKQTLSEAHHVLSLELKKEELDTIYTTIEKPLIPIVERMTEHGIQLDTEYLKKLSKRYHKELSKIEKKIWKHAGKEFNVASPKQLADVLFEDLNLSVPRQKKTSTGQKSTKESELQKLKDEHLIIPLILEHRELSKLLGTYIDALPQSVKEDGRLHAEFLQTGTTTGRMSSRNPNLQNIPIKGDRGKEIRKAFVAEKGKTLLSFDYSQIELRIAAILSEDKEFIDIFKQNKDVHTAVASRVFEVTEKQVTSEMRRRAKVINFGILYGMGVNALRTNLGTDRKEAQEFYNDYFEAYPTLATYLKDVVRDAARLGYTKTMYGRKRRFPGLSSKLPFIRAQAERMAMNAPIQGSEADIVKLAMVRVEEEMKKRGYEKKVFPILQIHDEIIYEVDTDVVDDVAPHIQKTLEGVVDQKKLKGVPITVHYAEGTDWGSMEK